MTSSSSPTCTLLFFFSSLLVLSLQTSSAAAYTIDISSFLRVPSNRFVDSVNQAITLLQNVSTSAILSPSTGDEDDFRLSNAISGCIDLLQMAAEDLRWSLSVIQTPKGNKYNIGTGNLSSDLRTWLSAALSHQETCMDGFEGTNGIVKIHVSHALEEGMSLVKDLLSQVIPDSYSSSVSSNGGFPSWLKAEDEKLLKTNAPDAVVVADGSGKYKTVMEAVQAAPERNRKRFVIHVKKGYYREYVEIKKWNIMIVGDGMDITVISGVKGKGFIARDISFENTAGPTNGQAVALLYDSDQLICLRCGIYGYQDSLYLHAGRQFFKGCKITGTVDFIFGDATAVLQNCTIQARKGTPKQKNTITAQSRGDPDKPTGFSFQKCSIIAHPDLLPFIGSTQTFLERPCDDFSRTVFIESYMSEVISGEGWLRWEDANKSRDSTLFYGEYKNYGPGSGVTNRVKWPGYHLLDDSQANKFKVNQFIKRYLWIPPTINYTVV